MVAPPQCGFPKADVAKGVQHLGGSMTDQNVTALRLRFLEDL
jgi:hypothetical protein